MSADKLYPAGAHSDIPYSQISTGEMAEQPAGIPRMGDHQRVRRNRPPRRGGKLVALLLLVIMVLLGIGGTWMYLQRNFQGKIYPNISVQGVKIGDHTPQEAEAVLRARYGRFLQQPATLTFGDRTWQPTPAELGISFDFQGAISSAYNAGRLYGLIENSQEVADIWQNGLDLPLRISFDERKMQEYVLALAAELDQPPVDATIQLQGANVIVTPARSGRQVLVDQTTQTLLEAVQQLKPAQITIQSRELPTRLDTAPVEAARRQIETLLQGPLVITAADQQQIWSPDELALMIELARVPANAQHDTITVNLNPYYIERRVRQIADATELIGTYPRLDWNEGDLRIKRPGDPGLRVDEQYARELILAAIQGSERTVELTMREVAPPVNDNNLHELGIKELVSVGKSDFTGSADYRITNIGVGMRLLDGILLAPGDEFSFNSYIGEIDETNGFVKGYAIVQNRTQLEFGGGICQDSTTMFRAAFWAGLPITERWGHSFYISWYDKYALGSEGDGPGLDATIFTGGPDLKFVNDTGHWLLIQTMSNPKTGVAEVALYGTNPSRQVELTQRVYNRIPAPTDPVYVADSKQRAGALHQSDKARGGMMIDVYRTVIDNGVKREPELFRTRFKPWPNIFVVNPVDMGPDGKPTIALPQPEGQPAPTPAPTDQLPPNLPPPASPAPDQPAPVQPTG